MCTKCNFEVTTFPIQSLENINGKDQIGKEI